MQKLFKPISRKAGCIEEEDICLQPYFGLSYHVRILSHWTLNTYNNTNSSNNNKQPYFGLTYHVRILSHWTLNTYNNTNSSNNNKQPYFGVTYHVRILSH